MTALPLGLSESGRALDLVLVALCAVLLAWAFRDRPRWGRR